MFLYDIQKGGVLSFSKLGLTQVLLTKASLGVPGSNLGRMQGRGERRREGTYVAYGADVLRGVNKGWVARNSPKVGRWSCSNPHRSQEIDDRCS